MCKWGSYRNIFEAAITIQVHIRIRCSSKMCIQLWFCVLQFVVQNVMWYGVDSVL